MPTGGTAITHVVKWWDHTSLSTSAAHVDLFRGHVKADARLVSMGQFSVDDEESQNMGRLLTMSTEGVVWIRGRFEDHSPDGQALLAAYRLWASAV
jgi:hypothetical protein